MGKGMRRAAAGFTLLELLVVVVIIGVLVAYVAPRYFQQIGKSERTAALGQIDALRKAIDAYWLDTGHFPSSELGLSSLTTRPEGEKKWNGPYLQGRVPPDPWGNAYVYRVPGTSGDYDLFSYGKDGRPGGEGDDADIGVDSEG
ncbi:MULTISPECIES: type II secretion system major pseudopilin GspG [unclassified Lysobacter]|uniref:type II secretion system major pseudopilin GspG n=1 Tax=unclassified Lysobacter TaxID=2635362 RepID=UPI001C235653|nr:type II secretion system major pseudopilin GspG [Lysobacter sp. MMG2]MBU8975705.1 type II secretion system major pseudopilin GspG [Lysobacter sp. MMG2]